MLSKELKGRICRVSRTDVDLPIRSLKNILYEFLIETLTSQGRRFSRMNLERAASLEV
jgi:hypothetical protein